METCCEVFVRLPSSGVLKSVLVPHGSCVSDLLSSVSASPEGGSEYFVLQNGFVKHCDDEVRGNETFDLCCRLRGGKGGFGSMLRAIGAQIEKTTNREACRDLSGRRLRAINDERRARHYARLKAQREIEREQKRRKKLESLATSKPHHEFNDEQYLKDRVEIPDRVEEAVEQAFAEVSEKRLCRGEEPRSRFRYASFESRLIRNSPQASPGPSGTKRAADEACAAASPKKIKGWMGDLEGFEDSDSESEKADNDSPSSGSEARASV
ncbi:replication stress response regulator SDE2 isoform X1 [Galendromus occidentalis]|uniref:Replication stress response regulator SDE2 isoform X1 n=1 Tax=Galendromus occidentalis TaxID=34638 RepID=A0AAJ7L4G5_9ACAR|nr:replication stress response regulator SDE2 isoform X1 [Galendromus occidentalis]